MNKTLYRYKDHDTLMEEGMKGSLMVDMGKDKGIHYTDGEVTIRLS